jgi:hypothetical protein
MSTEPTRPAEHVIGPDDLCPCGQPQEGSGYCSYACFSEFEMGAPLMDADVPRPPAVEPVEPLTPSVGGTGSRTGEREAQGSAQAADLLDVVRDTHTQCDCDECLGKIAAAVLTAAAGSLRQLGHVAAADRLASTAKDLTEGATS